jgi:hypothetical protein
VCNGGSTTHANSIAITTIDATKQTSYVYPCPQVLNYVIIIRTGADVVAQVSPNSAIYFYEFTSSSSTEKFWTTRFTITDENGNSTPPTNATQSNGDKIPWGTGMLVNGTDLASGSSSSLSSMPSGSSSTLSGSSSVLSSSSSSRLSSTRTSDPTQTGTTGSSQSNATGGGMIIAVPKALAFVIGLVAASATLL